MLIYQKVQQACKEENITIASLEEELKFPRGSIYKWNENIPSVVKVMAVANRLNKPIEFFLKDQEG